MTRYASALGAYTDIKHVFDLAITHGEVKYDLVTHAKAVSWRGRAYAYKRLLLKFSSQTLTGKNIAPSSPYDGVYMVLEKGESHVTIYRERPLGQITVIGGATPIHTQLNSGPADPLQEEADRLARENEIDI